MTAGCFGPEDVRPLTDRFVAALRNEFGERLLGVALYGSVARGEARSESDMDLLVVHEDEEPDPTATVIRAEAAVAEEARALEAAGVPARLPWSRCGAGISRTRPRS